MAKCLTVLADASKEKSDMKVNMTKTFTQYVFNRNYMTVTEVEVAAAESDFKHKCDFCTHRFKTQRHMTQQRPTPRAQAQTIQSIRM